MKYKMYQIDMKMNNYKKIKIHKIIYIKNVVMIMTAKMKT